MLAQTFFVQRFHQVLSQEQGDPWWSTRIQIKAAQPTHAVCVCAGSAPSNQVNIAPWTLLAFKQLVLNHQTPVQLRSDCKYYPWKGKSLTVRADKMFFVHTLFLGFQWPLNAKMLWHRLVPDTSPIRQLPQLHDKELSTWSALQHICTASLAAPSMIEWLIDWMYPIVIQYWPTFRCTPLDIAQIHDWIQTFDMIYVA